MCRKTAITANQYHNIMEAVFAVCRDNLIEAADGDDDVVEDDLEAPSNAIKLSYDIA